MSDLIDPPIGPASARQIAHDRLGRAIEFRPLPLAIRADGDPGFSGLANKHWVVDSYGTAFQPGAWLRTIAERGDKVRVLWQHDPSIPIGKPTKLADTADGLEVDATITEATQAGREAMALVREGIVTGLSVGFRTMRERPATADDPLDLSHAPEPIKRDPSYAWVIEEAKLYEFSPVTFPSNEQSTIAEVRRAQELAALDLLLADLKANRLSESGRQRLESLVAAWREASEGEIAPPRRAKAPRVDLALLQEELAWLLTA